MLAAMHAIAVIPARLGSTRLPRKVLREIAGKPGSTPKPMIGWIYEAAKRSPLLREVIVATDSEEIMDLCGKNGWRAQMTSPYCRSGTERVYEVSRQVAAEVYVNIQGDEPLTRPEHIAELLRVMAQDGVQVGTLKTRMAERDRENPNAVKVVTAQDGQALYFSRATIPYDRDRTGQIRYFKHLGFYAYRKPALERFMTLPESDLERWERLEQLRFLENGVSIYVGETPFDTIGVDTEEDLQRVDALLRRA